MILIFPPVAKPCEPPAGVALLSGALNRAGIEFKTIDASIEGLMWLINSDIVPEDSWTRRALKNRDAIISNLKDPALYQNIDRYRQNVFDLNKLLTQAVDQTRFKITLADYQDLALSPVRSADLIHSARSFDENPFYGYFEAHLLPQLTAHDSRYVGISLCYLNQALVAFALAGWIKARFPEMKIIMGGGLISSWARQPGFNHPFSDVIDILIEGEGEHPLLAVLGVPESSCRSVIPDYGFAPWDQYLAPGKILPFRASIGCYWSKCRFCPEKAEVRPYHSDRADRVVSQLEQLIQRHAPESVHFIDNAVTPAVLKALCRRNQDRESHHPFQWYGFVRFTKELADPDFCRDLAASGCRMLNLGLESGDQSVLDRMNKGTDLELASRALKSLHQAGILTYVYLLFGTAFEDQRAAIRTYEYVTAHEQWIDYLNLAVFNLPRFSEDAMDLDTHEFYEGDLSLYMNFTHPDGWERKQVKQFLDKHFKKNQSIAAIIRKTPPYFTSNHAMFLHPEKENV
ncbi:MAG: radical SAM protein [Desulfobacteraceae bacterium]|nr:MAG: radical SAM protein [Desulfobacteraceae bacterium]